MAPAHRNSRTSGRTVRDQSDHDVFSGLPVRHWRKQNITINPIPPKEESKKPRSQNSRWLELPMPKDSGLLPPWSQALLRDARMGHVFLPAAPPVEEAKKPGKDDDADGDIEHGFVATKWGLAPRHLEGPEPEFLAKRRKGLSSLYGAVSGAVGASNQMRKTKIKKVDSEGHEYILEALVPEGQSVEGEVTAEENTTVGEAPAPGTFVEGVGIVNAEGVVVAENQIQPTPSRRKPPPPKRKAKGPGRGKKKKVAFAPGVNGASPSRDINDPSSGAVNEEGVAQTNGSGDHAAGDGDIEMGEDLMLLDGEEGSEDEEGENGDREDGEHSPSPRPTSASPSKQPTAPEPEPDVETETKQKTPLVTHDLGAPDLSPKRDASSSPDVPLASNQSIQPPIIHVQVAETEEDPQRLSFSEPQEAPPTAPASIDDPLPEKESILIEDSEEDLLGSLEDTLG